MIKKKVFSAIKGLTPTLTERGKIKIGMKGAVRTSQSGSTYQLPQKIDHFRVVSMVRGNDGNFIPDKEIHDMYGDKPTALPVRLLYDDITLNFPTRLTCYRGQTQWCTGDNSEAVRVTESGAFQTVECPCERIDPAYRGRDKCKFNGALSCIIDGASVVGGVWKLRTTSYNSVVGLLSSMAQIKGITNGVLAGIPLKLTLSPKTVVNPVDQKIQTIFVVGLEYRGTQETLQQLGYDVAMKRVTHQIRMDRVEAEARRLLGSGEDYMDDDTVDEFYPEAASEGLETVESTPEVKESGPGEAISVKDEDMYAPTAESPSAPDFVPPEAKGRPIEGDAGIPRPPEKEEGEQEQLVLPEPGGIPDGSMDTVDPLPGETFEAGHEDWDESKYEAKRSGKYNPRDPKVKATGFQAYVMDHRATWPQASQDQQAAAKKKWYRVCKDWPFPLDVDKEGNLIVFALEPEDQASQAGEKPAKEAPKDDGRTDPRGQGKPLTFAQIVAMKRKEHGEYAVAEVLRDTTGIIDEAKVPMKQWTQVIAALKKLDDKPAPEEEPSGDGEWVHEKGGVKIVMPRDPDFENKCIAAIETIGQEKMVEIVEYVTDGNETSLLAVPALDRAEVLELAERQAALVKKRLETM